MNQPTPKSKYVITHPKDEDGEDLKFRFMLTLDRRLTDKVKNGGDEDYGTRALKAITTIDGIEACQPQSMYTLEIGIARTFDAIEVIAEIERRLNEEVLSSLIVPRLVT